MGSAIQMIYLYAIVEQPALPLPQLRGLYDLPPTMVVYGDLAAVVVSLVTAPAPEEALLWRHEAVVEALMDQRSVLPVRFGTLLADEAALERTLEVRYVEFQADLARLRGKVELGLRVLGRGDWTVESVAKSDDTPVAPTAGDASPGRAYLMAKLAQERANQQRRHAAEGLAELLQGRLAPLAEQTTARVLATPQLLLSAAYLVERGQVSAFQGAVTALAAEHPELRLLCTGPWPPYHFVSTAEG